MASVFPNLRGRIINETLGIAEVRNSSMKDVLST